MITFACVVLALVLGDVLSQSAVLSGGRELRARQAVTFTPYYQFSAVSDIQGAAQDLLIAGASDGTAYAAITNNVAVNNPDFADGVPTVVLIGDSVSAVLPGVDLCSPAPCAMRGAHLADWQINPIEFAGETFTPDMVLRSSATFFDPNVAGLNLDGRIVLLVPPSKFPLMDEFEREEAISKTVLLAPSSTEVDEFVSSAARDGLLLVPHDIAVDQPKRFSELMVMSAMYVAGLVAFLSLVLTAFASTADSAIRRESASFAIRRMYGAKPHHMLVRTGSFLAVTMLAAPVPLLLLLRLVGDPVAPGANVVLVVVLAIFGALWAVNYRRASSRDPIER